MLPSVQELTSILVLKGHTNSVECCAFHPQKDNVLITGSHDHTLKTWDVSTGECTDTLEAHKAGVWSCQFSNDGRRILTASPDKTVKLWDATGREYKNSATLVGHENLVYWAKFNDDNTLVASGGSDSQLIVWDLKKNAPLIKIQSEADIVYAVEFSKDGKYMMSCDSNGALNIYETNKFELYQTVQQPGSKAYALSVDFSKNSQINDGIFVAYDDHYSRMWKYDKERNYLDKTAQFGPHSDQVKNNIYHGKSNTLITCCKDGSAKIWDSKSKHLVANLVGHHDSVSCAAFSNTDPLLVAVGAWDQKTHIYKVPTF